jgi:UDP-N-acetylglucosamine:LPS N-acetylglucosamine transferase
VGATRVRGGTGAPSVLIISAAMGAGHDGVAHELERRLQAEGAQVEVVDYLELMPGRIGPFYRAFYQGQLRWAPGSYEWLYGKIDHGLLAPTARRLGRMGRSNVRRLVEDGGHDLVVSTYPLGCQAAGALRRSGKLRVPAVGFLTDVDVHGLWLHPGMDHNLTVWQGSAQIAMARVGTPSHAVGPVLPEMYREPVTAPERAAARARLELDDPHVPVVLVVAGSWGVGDIAGTARAIARSGVGVPVVLCGRNNELRAQLAAEGTGIAVGWTRDVRSLLAAADVLVHNAGGLSCLEAFAVGVPVIGHACLPGHGHRNAEAMRDAGVAALAASRQDLIAEIRRLACTPAGAAMAARARALFVADPTAELLALAGAPATVPAVRSRPVAIPAVRIPAPVRVPAQRRVPAWAARTAAISAIVPMTMGALSFGVAKAGEHGVGVADGCASVCAAAELDGREAGDPAVAAALRSYAITAAIGVGEGAPSPTDVVALNRAGVSLVGADHGVQTDDPRLQRDGIDAVAAAVTVATHEARPPVLLLHRAGLVERVVAWGRDVQLAEPWVVVPPGGPLPPLAERDQVVLDLRGRTTAQVGADLQAFSAAVARSHLRKQPMRVLWAAL